MTIDAEGFVLAGGRSSRMGSEKALIEFAGEPLVVHVLRILHGARLGTAIAGSHAPLDDFAPVVPDSEPDKGPLAGICAALASTSSRWGVFVPVDAPLLPPALITFLLEEAEKEGAAVTLAQIGGFAQTFPAVVESAVLPELRVELEAGRSGCFRAFCAAAARLGRKVKVVPIEQAIMDRKIAYHGSLPVAAWFLNVNTREDLARAEAAYRASSIQ